MDEVDFLQKSSILLKEAVSFLFFRYNELTAKEIQNKLGLKRQATYNYLNKLEKEGVLISERRPIPNNNRIKTTYYKLKNQRKNPEELSLYPKELYGNLKTEDARERIKSMINTTIGALLESKIFIDSLNDQELESYLLGDPDEIGPYFDLLGMGKTEFRAVGKKLHTFVTEHWKEWKDYKEETSEYLIMFGALKPMKKKD